MGNYKKLDDKDIAFIKNVIGDEERVLVGENINLAVQAAIRIL